MTRPTVRPGIPERKPPTDDAARLRREVRELQAQLRDRALSEREPSGEVGE